MLRLSSSSRTQAAWMTRRPEFQRLLDMTLTEAPPFNVIVVHSFSRFARDHFALEFQVRPTGFEPVASAFGGQRRGPTLSARYR
jgi:hypothetical protein